MNEAHAQNILKKWFEQKGFETIENYQINSKNNVDLVAMGQILKSITELEKEKSMLFAYLSVKPSTVRSFIID
jgi:hypothetical protein